MVKFGYINGITELVCEVQAEPPPTFKWYKELKGGRRKDFKGSVNNEETNKSVAKVNNRLEIIRVSTRQ